MDVDHRDESTDHDDGSAVPLDEIRGEVLSAFVEAQQVAMAIEVGGAPTSSKLECLEWQPLSGPDEKEATEWQKEATEWQQERSPHS